MKLPVKPSEALIAVGLFVVGWQISPLMTLCAAGLYFTVKRSGKPGYEQYPPHVEPYTQTSNNPMKITKNERLMDILVVLGVLAYLASPLDIVPDVIFPFGFIDDATVLGSAAKYFMNKRKKLPHPSSPPSPPSRHDDDDVIDVEWRRAS